MKQKFLIEDCGLLLDDDKLFIGSNNIIDVGKLNIEDLNKIIISYESLFNKYSQCVNKLSQIMNNSDFSNFYYGDVLGEEVNYICPSCKNSFYLKKIDKMYGRICDKCQAIEDVETFYID
jgi:hypothetical protein